MSLLFVQIRVEQQAASANHTVERRSQFVRHVRQELALGPIGGFGGQFGGLELVSPGPQFDRLRFEAAFGHEQLGVRLSQRRFGPLEFFELFLDRLPGLSRDFGEVGLFSDGLRHLQDFDGIERLLQDIEVA